MAFSEPTPSTVAIVLAAGMGRRFGGPKVLAELSGKPVIVWTVEAARTAGAQAIIVVAGSHGDAITTALATHADVAVIENPLPELGQSMSLRVGLEAAGAYNVDAAVLLLADEPMIDPAVINDVVTAASDGMIARAAYRDGPGHPVVLPRGYWDDVAAGVYGDAGARSVLAHLAVRDVVVDTQRPIDVDEPDDLRVIADGLASP